MDSSLALVDFMFVRLMCFGLNLDVFASMAFSMSTHDIAAPEFMIVCDFLGYTFFILGMPASRRGFVISIFAS